MGLGPFWPAVLGRVNPCTCVAHVFVCVYSQLPLELLADVLSNCTAASRARFSLRHIPLRPTLAVVAPHSLHTHSNVSSIVLTVSVYLSTCVFSLAYVKSHTVCGQIVTSFGSAAHLITHHGRICLPSHQTNTLSCRRLRPVSDTLRTRCRLPGSWSFRYRPTTARLPRIRW